MNFKITGLFAKNEMNRMYLDEYYFVFGIP